MLAVMSPGPDFILMLRNSVAYSRRTALFSAVGLGLGIATHVTYCLLGIALVISKSILLFNVIKYFGAAYLLYIGIKSLLSKKSEHPEALETRKQKDISPLQAIRQGYLTNVLNPKATLFFLAVFTQVISSGTPVVWKFAYGLEMVLATIVWFSVVAVFMTQARVQKKFMSIKHHIEHFFGAVLVALGLKVALTTR